MSVSVSTAIDRSTAWVGAASVVAGVLDATSTIAVIQLGVTTEQLGIATVAAALFPIVDRLGGQGLTSAAVREPADDNGDGDSSTVFWLALAAACGATALAAAVRALAFPHALAAGLVVAYTSRLIARSFAVVPEARMRRALRYRELSIVRVVASFADTAVKLGCAYAGVRGENSLAIWCFALGPIANAVVWTCGVHVCERWRPRLAFQRALAARALAFTAQVAGGELLYLVYSNADYLVIGAAFGDAAVGVYRLAYELVLDVVQLLSSVTSEVAFSTFVRVSAAVAGDRRGDGVGEQWLRFTRQNAVVIAPVLIFLGVEADDLLAVLFDVHAPAAATAARILCAVGALRVLSAIPPPMLAATGAARRVVAYHAIAAVALPAGFAIAAVAAPTYEYVAVATAWALAYPIAFAALIAMALAWTGVPAPRYAGALVGIAACAVGAGGVAAVMRAVLPEAPVPRLAALAVAIVVTYAALLARIERITLRTVIRRLRQTDR